MGPPLQVTCLVRQNLLTPLCDVQSNVILGGSVIDSMPQSSCDLTPVLATLQHMISLMEHMLVACPVTADIAFVKSWTHTLTAGFHMMWGSKRRTSVHWQQRKQSTM